MKPHFFMKTRPDSINQKIFRAAVIIGLLTVVTRVATVFKELAVARTLGRSDAMDAFLIAFLLLWLGFSFHTQGTPPTTEILYG